MDPINVAQFNDPIAEETEWSALPIGMTMLHVVTQVTSLVGPDRLEFKPSPWFIRFLLMIASIPLVIGLVLFAVNPTPPKMILFICCILLVPSLLFVVLAWMMTIKPIVFDQTLGTFWRGTKLPPTPLDDGETREVCVKLDEVHAVQLISDVVYKKMAFQMNLVLKNGRRIKVIEHGHPTYLQQDAEKVAQFLGVPVWNGITRDWLKRKLTRETA